MHLAGEMVVVKVLIDICIFDFLLSYFIALNLLFVSIPHRST